MKWFSKQRLNKFIPVGVMVLSLLVVQVGVEGWANTGPNQATPLSSSTMNNKKLNETGLSMKSSDLQIEETITILKPAQHSSVSPKASEANSSKRGKREKLSLALLFLYVVAEKNQS